jgi:ribonuclease HI
MPNFAKTFCIETDSSNKGVGVVLLQEGHPLAFISKPLGPRTQGLSTNEKEYLAILTAMDYWRSYLQQAEFIIYTDQKSLVHLNEQRLNAPWQQRMYSKLIGLHYKIVYKKGTNNGAVDALSRRPHESAQLLAIATAAPKWISEVCARFESDSIASAMISKLSVDPAAIPNFTFSDGLLRYKKRICVGNVPSFHQKIIVALHNSPLGGHSGVPVTVRKLKHYFAWNGMKTSVHAFVSAC